MKKLLFVLFLLLFSFEVKAEFYGLFIGVAKYSDTLYNASNIDLETKNFKDMFFRPNDDKLMLITNQRATRENLLNALKAQCSRADEDDVLLIFYAGRTTNGFISSFDEIYGISLDEIKQIIETSSAGTKMLIMNNCAKTFKPGISEDKFIKTFSGMDIMAIQSARINERAINSVELGETYYMYYLKQGLFGRADINGDGKITSYELYAYIKVQVNDKTDGMQNPVLCGAIDPWMPIFYSN